MNHNFLQEEQSPIEETEANQEAEASQDADEAVVLTKDMLIAEVIQRKPRTIQLLMMVGLGCIGCPSSMMETVEQGALVHGIDPDVLVEKLNEY